MQSYVRGVEPELVIIFEDLDDHVLLVFTVALAFQKGMARRGEVVFLNIDVVKWVVRRPTYPFILNNVSRPHIVFARQRPWVTRL